MNVVAQFESGAKRTHSKTLSRGKTRSQLRKVLGCVRFAPLLIVIALSQRLSVHAQDWQSHFANIPIRARSFRAHLTPPVELILTNFQPSAEIRAVVLMPGAADRLYFYDWGEVTL